MPTSSRDANPGRTKARRFWDRQADGFDEQQSGVNVFVNKDYKMVLKYLHADDIILDYGCGTGIISNAIAGKAKTVHSIDISPRMIEIAVAKAGERGITNVHYSTATIFDGRYDAGSFDMVLAFRVLYLLEDLPAVVLRIGELLKPGGVFISVSTCAGSLKSVFNALLFLLRKTRILTLPVNLFRLSELQRMLVERGFRIVECERMDDPISTYCVVVTER